MLRYLLWPPGLAPEMHQFLVGLPSVDVRQPYVDVTLGSTVPCGTGVGSLIPLRTGNISKVVSNVMVSLSNRTV